nr:cation:proton antiporter [Streptomyces sp. NBC_00899]
MSASAALPGALSGADPGHVQLAARSADMVTGIMLADIAVVIVLGLALGRVFRRLRQPAVIGEIAAGIALGPSLLGQLPGDLSHRLFPSEVRPLLNAISQVALVLFMFAVGWEFDKRLVRPHARLAAGVSLSSIALAFGLGVATAPVLYPDHSTVAGHHISFATFAVFLGTAMSVTAFPVLARILNDNRLIDTRVGTLALASAAVDDVLAWCLLAYVSAMVTADGDYHKLLSTVGYGLLFTTGMLLVVRPVLGGLVRQWAAAERWRPLLMVLASGALVSAWLTTWIGLHAIFGAFLFGFVTPREPAALLARHVRRPMDDMGLILLPVFFVVTGLNVDLSALTASDSLALLLIVAVSCAGKLLGAFVPARLAGLGCREAKNLGLLMNTRGLTELVILNAAMTLGVLDVRMFTMMVVMALVTTAMAAPLLSPREDLVALTPKEPRPVRV